MLYTHMLHNLPLCSLAGYTFKVFLIIRFSHKPLEQGGYSSIQLPVVVGADIDAEIQSCAAVITKGDSNVENNLVCVISKVEGKRDGEKSLLTPMQELQVTAASTPSDEPTTLIYIPVVRD